MPCPEFLPGAAVRHRPEFHRGRSGRSHRGCIGESRPGRIDYSHRCQFRKGPARQQRDHAVASRFHHQADDALHDAERAARSAHHGRHAVHGVGQCGDAIAHQDGLSARHAGHHRQRAQDDDGEVGERHGDDARRRTWRHGRPICPGNDRHRASPGHDAKPITSIPTACRTTIRLLRRAISPFLPAHCFTISRNTVFIGTSRRSNMAGASSAITIRCSAAIPAPTA